MASARIAPKAATLMGAATRQAVRPALRSSFQPAQRTFSVASQRGSTLASSALKRQQVSNLLKNPAVHNAFGRQTRPYSSEMAQALVEASQNIGMGTAAVGLGGSGIGIGLVFAALVLGIARNPSVRPAMFQSAILGFAFCEAMGLFDLMVAMMAKFI